MISLLLLAAMLSASPPHRSSTARRQFQRIHPCPVTGSTRGACPGYVVDHLVALRCGGRDAVENMRWEPAAQAKREDREERKCGKSPDKQRPGRD